MTCFKFFSRRLLSVRLAMLSLGATMFFCALSLMLHLSPSDRPTRALNSLEAVLNNVISAHVLRDSNVLAGTSKPHLIGDNTLTRILAIQESLRCFTEGTWDFAHNRRSYPFSRISRAMTPRYLLSPLCSSTRRIVNSAAELCTLLSAKNILLVGPETTFYLHSLWLHALEDLEKRRFHCLGPEFCTLHRICQHQSGRSENFTVDNDDGHFRRPPRQQDLVDSSASLLRYVLSTSLHTSDNPHDAVYVRPVVDRATGVRVRSGYWRAHARKADVIILNRGPLPAPAWTYGDGNSEGNWSFVDELYLDNSTIYLKESKSFATRLINAALHVTLVSFLPSTIRSLTALREDPVLRQKILIWHGSWYLQQLCPVNHSLAKHNLLVGNLRYPFSSQTSSTIDPWSLYYNAQGWTYLSYVVLYSDLIIAVYMQNRLMQDILPHFGIVFFPQATPSHPPADIQFPDRKATASHNKQSHTKDCLTYPFSTFGAKAMETIFLGGLVRLAEQTA